MGINKTLMLKIPLEEIVLYKYASSKREWKNAWKKDVSSKRSFWLSVVILAIICTLFSALIGAMKLTPLWSVIITGVICMLVGILSTIYTNPLAPREWALGSNAIYFSAGGKYFGTGKISWSKLNSRNIAIKRLNQGLMLKPEKWYYPKICLFTTEIEKIEAIIKTNIKVRY
jgi:hypothetical protein